MGDVHIPVSALASGGSPQLAKFVTPCNSSTTVSTSSNLLIHTTFSEKLQSEAKTEVTSPPVSANEVSELKGKKAVSPGHRTILKSTRPT